jgi:hypothetical protein
VSGRLWRLGNVIVELDATGAALRPAGAGMSGRLWYLGTVVVDLDAAVTATLVLRERS